MLNLHTVSRKNLFEAKAIYDEGKVKVLKGSRIKITPNDKFKPPQIVAEKRNDKNLVNDEGYLLEDVIFNSLSTAATFVAGRTSNGMITWKTEDGRYVRYTLKGND